MVLKPSSYGFLNSQLPCVRLNLIIQMAHANYLLDQILQFALQLNDTMHR